jgi:hypothetical protein
MEQRFLGVGEIAHKEVEELIVTIAQGKGTDLRNFFFMRTLTASLCWVIMKTHVSCQSFSLSQHSMRFLYPLLELLERLVQEKSAWKTSVLRHNEHRQGARTRGTTPTIYQLP